MYSEAVQIAKTNNLSFHYFLISVQSFLKISYFVSYIVKLFVNSCEIFL